MDIKWNIDIFETLKRSNNSISSYLHILFHNESTHKNVFIRVHFVQNQKKILYGKTLHNFNPNF